MTALLLGLLLLRPGPAWPRNDPALDWKTLESDHFYMHYYVGEEALAQDFLALSEEAHAALAVRFGFQPSEKGQLVLVDDVDTANGLTSVLPYNYIVFYSYIPDAAGDLGNWLDWKRILVYHEMTHLFHLDRATGLPGLGNVLLGKTFLPNSTLPSWFSEGIAVTVESVIGAGGRIRSPLFEMYLRTHALGRGLLSLDEASGAPIDLPWGTAPYLYGAYFMNWLAARHGSASLSRFVEEQSGKVNPYSVNISCRRIFGLELTGLYEQWAAETTRRLQDEAAVVRASGLQEGERLAFGGIGQPMPSFGPDGSLIWTRSTGRDTPRLVRMDAGGAVEELITCRGGCDRPRQGADGSILFSGSTYFRTFYYFQDMFSFSDSEGRRRLTHGARAKDPASSADGRTVAFVRTRSGRSALVLLDLPAGTEKTLLEVDGGLSWPAWSPDGTRLAVGLHDASGAQVALVETGSGAVERLTRGSGVHIHPEWSPDGRWLLLSSAARGIFDVYAVDPEARCAVAQTRVLGGAFSPTVSPDGKSVVFASYNAAGFDLRRVALVTDGCGQADWLERGEAPLAAQAPIPELPDTVKEEEYCPLLHLAPRSWSPSFLTDSFSTTVFGADTSGRDPVGEISWALSGSVNTVTWDSAATASMNVGFFYPSVQLFGGYYRSTALARVEDEYKDYREDDTYGSVAISFPFPDPDYSLSVYSGYSFDRFSGRIVGEWEHDPGGSEPYIPPAGNLATLYTGVSFDSTESFGYSVTKEKGIAASTELRWSTPPIGSNWTEYHVKWSLTSYMQLPWVEHHVLMTQVRGGYADGREQFLRSFAVGGYPDTDPINDLMYGRGVSGTYLRGYPPVALRGSQYHFVAADYYFPVWRIRRGFQSFPIFFKDLYVDVFGTGATAFNEFSTDLLLPSTGAELRLTGMHSYHTPFSVYLGSAYGFREPGGLAFYVMVGN